jgi:abortive infection bacteriophage resistance protein
VIAVPETSSLTYGQQVDLLRSRGLSIKDNRSAEDILSRVSYYRLINGYAIGLINDGRFAPLTTIESLYDIYRFDIALRQELFARIELFEVEFRTAVAYHIATTHDPLAYLCAELYQDEAIFQEFRQRYYTMINKGQAKNLIVHHHKEKYNDDIPIWAAVELLSFGTMSKLYSNLHMDDQKAIALRWNVSPKYFRSWAYSLVEVRNVCAHFSRMYNRPLANRPLLFKRYRRFASPLLFSRMIILCSVMLNEGERDSFVAGIGASIENYSASICLDRIGFPVDWEKVLLSTSLR